MSRHGVVQLHASCGWGDLVPHVVPTFHHTSHGHPCCTCMIVLPAYIVYKKLFLMPGHWCCDKTSPARQLDLPDSQPVVLPHLLQRHNWELGEESCQNWIVLAHWCCDRVCTWWWWWCNCSTFLITIHHLAGLVPCSKQVEDEAEVQLSNSQVLSSYGCTMYRSILFSSQLWRCRRWGNTTGWESGKSSCLAGVVTSWIQCCQPS